MKRASLLVAILLTSFSASATTTIGPPMDLKALTGAWIGFVHPMFMRLQLGPDGRGSLTGHNLAAGYVEFRVVATKLSGYDVSFTIEPVDGHDAVQLSGFTRDHQLVLTLVHHGEVHTQFVLWPESNVMSILEGMRTRGSKIAAAASRH